MSATSEKRDDRNGAVRNVAMPALDRCPACGARGKAVKAITIEALVNEDARRRAGRSDGFRYCAGPTCEVAYFHPATGSPIRKNELRVRIGGKETEAPRPVCYCFDHTIEEVEAEVARTGASTISVEIAEKCRQGLHRCEETNPQGSCCLGDVRRATGAGRSGPVAPDRGPEGILWSWFPPPPRPPRPRLRPPSGRRSRGSTPPESLPGG